MEKEEKRERAGDKSARDSSGKGKMLGQQIKIASNSLPSKFLLIPTRLKTLNSSRRLSKKAKMAETAFLSG